MKQFGDRCAIGIFAALIIFTVAFLLLPVFVALVMSFDSRSYLGTFPPPGFSLKWYQSFLASSEYLHGLRTSVIVATVSAGLATAVGGAAAVFLDRYRFRGRDALTAFFLSPLVVPGVVMGFALLMFYSLCGLYDGYARLLGGHLVISLPYTIRTTLASLAGIRRSLAQAALSLGANERQAFWEITLPLAKTGIAAGAVFAFALSMDEVAASLFLSDPFAYTLPVAIISEMRSNFDLTIAAVSGVLIVFTVLLIGLLDRLVGLDRLIGVGVYRA